MIQTQIQNVMSHSLSENIRCTVKPIDDCRYNRSIRVKCNRIETANNPFANTIVLGIRKFTFRQQHGPIAAILFVE